MAQVARRAQLQPRIDQYLDNLMRTWEGVPFDAQEWAEWDDLSQLTYAVNWPVNEDQLHMLAQWAEQGLLAPEQRARYGELLQLVERHRPLLEELLKD